MSWRDPRSKSAPTLGGLDSEDLTSTYRDILSEGRPSTAAPSSSPWAPSVPAVLPQALRLLRSLFLFSMSAAGSAMAALGLGLLAYLLLSRALTPPQHLYARTLHLDYSQADLVAQTAFLPADEMGDGIVPDGLPPSTRFLPSGQRVDVWVELLLPPSYANCRGGMAQVVAELVSLDGRTAARTSRPLLLRRSGWDLWALATAPLRWVGVVADARTVRVPLFQNYKEKDKTPFVVFQVAIKTRDPSWAPEVLGAQVKVQLRMGLLTRALYALRPGTLLMLLLACAALASVVGGSTAAAVFLALWAWLAWGPAAGEAGGGEGAAGEEQLSSSVSLSGAEGEDDLGSISGLSEVESVGGRRSGGAEVAPEPGRPRWPAEGLDEEDWQEVQAETSAAGAAAAGGGAAQGRGLAWGPSAKGKGPASAALSANDTAYLDSQPPSLAGARAEGTGQMRRRSSAGLGRRASGGF